MSSNVPLVGMEPSADGGRGQPDAHDQPVCATPRTVESPRYAWLKEIYPRGVRVLEPDCSDWSSMIEANLRQRPPHSLAIVDASIAEGSDQIVLWLHALPLDPGHDPGLRRRVRLSR